MCVAAGVSRTKREGLGKEGGNGEGEVLQGLTRGSLAEGAEEKQSKRKVGMDYKRREGVEERRMEGAIREAMER